MIISKDTLLGIPEDKGMVIGPFLFYHSYDEKTHCYGICLNKTSNEPLWINEKGTETAEEAAEYMMTFLRNMKEMIK